MMLLRRSVILVKDLLCDVYGLACVLTFPKVSACGSGWYPA